MKNIAIFVLVGVFIIIGNTGCSSRLNVLSQEKQVGLPANERVFPIGEIGDKLYAEEIQESVYVINHEFPWPSNSMVVEMETGDIVLVDTPYTPAATKQLLDWIHKRFGEREIIAINTGFHFDNLGGNQVLVQKDIPVYGSSLTELLIYEYGEASRELMLSWLNKPETKELYNVYQQIPYVPPTEIFNLDKVDLQNFRFGNEEVEIYYPGQSHSPDNLVVYFPEKNILFGGCMIKSLDSKDLGNTADANLQEWPKSVKKVLERYKDSKIVIPGHGKWGNIDLIKYTLQLCEEKS
ncbi:subclass B1 metallo-beta-lactamase [Geosporobacter ferrireducens]|uniref:beta-lactamase n=1 Tax=Geosporobacter ferrireducens TaxID=1424294 RepID=A0A1D8GF94_9FIRM|nr:subclass B1 metallo-beta-lactamase [Geosporobacter ferrireducens]AOT69571.1 hypothetical protein Gferi_08260 [Geosporobacter ferrireducens]